jgi:cyclase
MWYDIKNDEVGAPKHPLSAFGTPIMLSKRIIPCLDVRDGKTTKGIRFQDNRDIGDPVQMARFYYEAGADEIVFYDITASSDHRDIMIDVVTRVAQEIFIPFSVGGGIGTIDDMRRVLLAGAEKVSVNTAAVLDPKIVAKGATVFGSQCIVLGMDVKKVGTTKAIPSGYEIVIHGGRTPTGMDALSWAQEAERLGAGEICLNSIDTDGTQEGYELNLTALISESVGIPVIASGGAGCIDHIYEVFAKGKADAALVASIVHYETYSIREIKQDLHSRGVKVRMTW